MDSWPFADPPNLESITSRQVVYGDQPILRVVHDAVDGNWQFLTGDGFHIADALVVSLGNVVRRDPGLVELADLPLGWQAWRETSNSPWQRRLCETGDA